MTQPPGPWGPKDLADKKAWLLHVDTGVVSRAARYYEAGEEIVNAHGTRKLDVPVMELETGDQLCVHGPDTFVPLSAREVQLVEGATQLLTQTITIVLRQANALKIGLSAASQLLLGVLKVSERVLDLEARKASATRTGRC